MSRAIIKMFRTGFLIILALCSIIGRGQGKQVNVSVFFTELQTTDSLTLLIVNPFYYESEPIFAKRQIKAAMGKDNKFHFSFDIESKIEYFVIIQSNNAVLDKGIPNATSLTPLAFLEQNDHVSILISRRKGEWRFNTNLYQRYHYSFAGKGSEKLKLLSELDSIQRLVGDRDLPLFNGDYKYNDPASLHIKAAVAFVKNHERKISPLAYNLIKADLIFQNSDSRFSQIKAYYRDNIAHLSELENKKFRASYNATMDTLFHFEQLSNEALCRSYYYLRHANFECTASVVINKGENSPNNVLDRLISEYDGEPRERALVYFLINSPTEDDQLQKLSKRIEGFLLSDYCKSELEKVKLRFSSAGFFKESLTDQEGRSISMDQFKGKVLILDFWYTGCGACIEFNNNVMAKVERNFKDNSSVIFLSISSDLDKNKWLLSLKSGLYSGESALNLYTGGMGFKHPIISKFKISFFPTLVVIGKDGRLTSFRNTNYMQSAELLVQHINNLIDKDGS